MRLFHKDVPATVVALCFTMAGAAEAGDRAWSYTYNGTGQLMSADGPRSDVDDITRYTYDGAGNRTSVTNALGHLSQMQDYNFLGQPRRMIDANGVVTILSYHPRGWLLSSTVQHPFDSSQDATTSYRYDNEGQLVATTLPDGAVLNNEYDGAHRLIAVSNSRGDRIEYAIDKAGNRVSETTRDSSGSIRRSLTMVYDELSRVISITGAGGQIGSFSYDNNGNQIKQTDGRQNVTSRSFDVLNRLIGRFAPLSNHIEWEHDGRDNAASITDSKGLMTRYGYDGLDNLAYEDSPDTGFTSHDYDEAGNLTTQSDANGVMTHYSYDALNRLTTVQYPNSSLNVVYGYDAGNYGKGRLTSITDASGVTTLGYDHRGKVVLQRLDTGKQILELSYAYDITGRLVRINYPSGRAVDFMRNSNGRVSAVTSSFGGDSQLLASSIEYLPFGPVSQMDYGNGVHYSAEFDLDYRVSRMSHGTIRDVIYSYGASGNITSMLNVLDESESSDFAYDALDRLISVEGRDGILNYSYDNNYNRLSDADASGVRSYNYDPNSHRLTQSDEYDYQYDPNGNLVAKLVRSDDSGDGDLYYYDDNNRLARVSRRHTTSEGQVETELASYVYNAIGQRARKKTADGTTYYLYGQDGLLLAELGENGAVQREYVYLNGQPLAVAYTSEIQRPATPGIEIVFDDGDPETSQVGFWERVRKKGALNDYYRRSENSGSIYRWTPSSLSPSSYEVWAWWPKTRKNNADARYKIVHSGQSSIARGNQASLGKRWTLLGTYEFDASGGEYIELSDNGGKTAADGIRMVELVRPPAEITTVLYYFHNDHLGTPQLITGTDQTVVWKGAYKPFGEVDIKVSTIENNVRFPGQYFDEESGLYQNYFRDYEPLLGRYVQADPVGLDGSGINPDVTAAQKADVPTRKFATGASEDNLYAYVQQNPISNIDPLGLACYVQESTGTRVCDTANELGFSHNFSKDGDNSAFPASTNNSNVKNCIRRRMKKCNTVPTSPGKACDIRAAATQAAACSLIVVTQCTATGGN